VPASWFVPGLLLHNLALPCYCKSVIAICLLGVAVREDYGLESNPFYEQFGHMSPPHTNELRTKRRETRTKARAKLESKNQPRVKAKQGTDESTSQSEARSCVPCYSKGVK